jgi:hypothetical protein
MDRRMRTHSGLEVRIFRLDPRSCATYLDGLGALTDLQLNVRGSRLVLERQSRIERIVRAVHGWNRA